MFTDNYSFVAVEIVFIITSICMFIVKEDGWEGMPVMPGILFLLLNLILFGIYGGLVLVYNLGVK